MNCKHVLRFIYNNYGTGKVTEEKLFQNLPSGLKSNIHKVKKWIAQLCSEGKVERSKRKKGHELKITNTGLRYI